MYIYIYVYIHTCKICIRDLNSDHDSTVAFARGTSVTVGFRPQRCMYCGFSGKCSANKRSASDTVSPT